ncbi:MAG: HAD-IC family P-type ATPase, partial [Tepidiformaceae bacterium]
HRVRVGTFEFVTSGMELDHARRRFGRRLLREASSVAFVAIDDDLAGAIVLEDPIRPEAAYVIREAKRYGIQQTVMVTGDDVAIAAPVGAALGIDRVQAGLTPAEKVAAVADASRTSIVLMVGDGINDAPALAMASVGIAMGARGATAASEAADAVIVVDRLDRIIDAIRIGRRSRSIALQSVLVGMGLSFVAMGFAAAGLLPPVAGAILQEGIDAIAILNALRALTGTPYERRRDVLDDATATELREGHRQMMAALGMLRRLADHVGELPAPELHAEVGRVREFLADVAEHERHDETEVMPKIAEALGGPDPLAAISRTHQELFHLISDFDQLTSDLPPAGLESEDLPDLRRVLYSLFTILRLNIAQEEELYRSLNDDYLVLEEAKASA